MFLTALSSFFLAIWWGLWKKSLSFWVSPTLQYLLWSLWWAVFCGFLLYIWKITGPISIFFIFPFIDFLFNIKLNALKQEIYLKEKLSVLIPYESLSKVISIILMYFLFWDFSFYSLLIWIFIILILFINSTWWKLKLPKKFIPIFVFNSLTAFSTLFYWYYISKIWAFNAFFYYILTAFFLFFLYVFFKKNRDYIKNIDKNYYKIRLSASVIWCTWWWISMFVIDSVWVWMSIILSFISGLISMVVTYFLLWERPWVKDIILNIFIAVLVYLAYSLS